MWTTQQLAGTLCLVVDGELGRVHSVRDATDLVGEALSEGAATIVIPVEALDGSFFDLGTGFAGEVLQKAANYRLKLAIVGDVSAYAAKSRAFHDLVVESARSTGYFFLPDMGALPERLSR
jgi:Domain of unknown function (DUF4180)